jgi:Meckel syndrome type 1 protein
MTNARRDLATPEPWMRSLERSRRRRELLPKARREHNRRKHLSAALATAAVAGPAAPVAAAQVSGDLSAAVASESPASRAIEIREGGLPLQAGSQGELVAHVQRALHISADGVFGVQTDAAVRSYQRSAGLEVDGIVGLATWGALFESQTASGASIGGSNVPPEVKQHVERELEQAGRELAAQGEPQGGAELASPGTGTTTPSAPESTTSTPAPPATGQACGSATISSPVSGTVTSEFGPRWGRNHDGVDISAPTGTPVRAAACGTVSLAGQQSGYGNMVCITHTSQFSTCYAHLSRFGVSNGAQVRQGQVIGYVGCTGSCTGPHLHFETRVGGQAQNPKAYLGGTSIPGKSASVSSTANIGGPDLPQDVLRQAAVGTPATTTADGTVTYETAPAEPAVPAESTVPAEAPVTEVPVEATPVEAAPVEEVAVPAPVEPAVEATVTAPAPVEPVVDATVAVPAPVEPAPVEPAVDATVAAPAPVEPPAEATASASAPVEPVADAAVTAEVAE